MKRVTLLGIIFIFFTTGLLASKVTSTSVQTVGTTTKKKKKESRYDKFERLFSDYDGNFMKDMFVYSLDIMMPDEMIKAAKDVINHREKESYVVGDEEFPKRVSTDAYNFFLTTGYYYIQDFTQITRRVWNKSICSPDTFIYDPKLDPKVDLTLTKDDDGISGVSSNGIVLPFNRNFPLAQYPYAQRPNGCSAEELEYVYDLSNTFSNDDEWIGKACDEHDKCYSTIGVTYKECNEQFIINTIDSCNEISTPNTILFMGSKNAFCGFKAMTIATGANSCAKKYFKKAQKKQKAYNTWIAKYEKAYLEAKNK